MSDTTRLTELHFGCQGNVLWKVQLTHRDSVATRVTRFCVLCEVRAETEETIEHQNVL
jgi:hypothetical protein